MNVPWALTEIDGGSLNSDKLVSHLILTINSVKPVHGDVTNAYDKFVQLQQDAGISELDVVLPPQYFKSCVLDISSISIENHEIYLIFNDLPVGLMADGCSLNTCASDKLTTKYSFITPNARCSSHAADGNIKKNVQIFCCGQNFHCALSINHALLSIEW